MEACERIDRWGAKTFPDPLNQELPESTFHDSTFDDASAGDYVSYENLISPN